MDRALRMDSAAFSGPMVKMVTSASAPAPRWASAICRPSSMAYSSSSLMSPSTDARSSVPSASLSLRSAGIWHLLDQHDDVHRLHRPPCSLAYSLPNRTATPGTGSTDAMLLVSSLYGVILMATRP